MGDVELPESGFGGIVIRAGKRREVPVTPELVRLLRAWVSGAGLRQDDLLFPDERGGPHSPSVHRRVWQQAREAVLEPGELDSKLGEEVSALRESCLVSWLKADIPAWVVAELAGVTPSWIVLRYPHCFRLENVEIDWEHLTKVMALPELHER
jgi:integrase